MSVSVTIDINCPPTTGVETERLMFEPVRDEHWKFYEELFQNAVATEKFAGRVTKERFYNWVKRWEHHHFSAFAVFLKSRERVADGIVRISKVFLGHAILGHGDLLEEDLEAGFSEIAGVVDPRFWNRKYKDITKGIGIANLEGIGAEIFRMLVSYARALFDLKIKVPVDFTDQQKETVQRLLQNNQIEKGLIVDGVLKAVYVPFKKIQATSSRLNAASFGICSNLLGTGAPIKNSADRYLFRLPLEQARLNWEVKVIQPF